MKKTVIIIFTIVCFTSAQAKPGWYRGEPGGGLFWIPAATVVTLFGLVSLNNERDYREFDRGVTETVYLIEDAESIEELAGIKADRSRYFTEYVQDFYREKRNSLSGEASFSETSDKNIQLTLFLIKDAESIEELETIKKERLKYFTKDVQEAYFSRKKFISTKK